MNFPLVEQYKFDIDGTNPENKVTDEPISTPEGIWNRVIVPVNGPFFVDSLELTSPAGKPLIEEEDFRIFRTMGRLTKFCGQEVACLIELLKPEITDVLATYQVVGENSLFDRSLLQLIISAFNDDRPVHWQYVDDKPVAFPPPVHGHSLIYDIVAFQDLISMVDELIDYLVNVHVEPMLQKLDNAEKIIDWYIDLYTRSLQEYYNRHVAAYNSHGLTALQADAQNINNFATATLNQSIQGERRDLVIKPNGLDALFKEYGYNPDLYLESNVIPLSRYGSRNFIPPSIDGSYEGLGSSSETTAVCMEGTGELTIIRNHFDGRKNGLYFSLVHTATDGSLTYEFTGYRYQHQRLIGDGVDVDAIIAGSNEQVLMIGKERTNDWYLCSCRGSYDPAKHILSKTDLSLVLADLELGTLTDSRPLHVHYFGKWIYLLASKNGSEGSNAEVYFYRILTANVEAGIATRWERVNVSFTSYDGKVYTNSRFFKGYERVLDGNGRVTRAFFNYVPYATSNCMNVWRSVNTSAYDETGKTPSIIRFQYYFQSNYSVAEKTMVVEQRPVIVYTFNPDTAVLTLRDKTPTGTINFNTMTQSDLNNFTADRNTAAHYVRPNGGYGYSQCILPNGKLFVPGVVGDMAYPAQSVVVDYFRNSRYELASIAWTKANVPSYKLNVASGLIRSPLTNNVKTVAIGFDGNNEVINGKQQTAEDTDSVYFYRKVSGGYAVRDGISNVNYPNIMSRPLVNTVYKTNIRNSVPFISMSGPQALLTAAGVSMGKMAWSVGMIANSVPMAPGFGDTTKDGYPFAFPKSVVWAQSGSQMVASISRYYAVTQATINKLNALLPASALKAFQIFVINTGDFGGMYNGGPLAVIMSMYNEAAVSKNHCYWHTVRLTIETANAVHPNSDVITDFTLVSTSPVKDDNDVLSPPNAEIFFRDKTGNAHVYNNNDGTLTLGITCPLSFSVISDSHGFIATMTIRLSDYVLLSETTTLTNWTLRDNQTYAALPNIGLTFVQSGAEAGYAALTSVGGDGRRYLLASVYPETGWIIYFQQPQDAIFNGMPYTLPVGTIDLRDVNAAPQNKTFHIYAVLSGGVPMYEVSVQKLDDTAFRMWIGKAVTNDKQILSLERYNVFTLNGKRVSEIKRGSAIPASSGSVITDGQIPWLYPSEILPEQ